jgi:hypothetical protein
MGAALCERGVWFPRLQVVFSIAFELNGNAALLPGITKTAGVISTSSGGDP